jgi:hypothetical protein
MIKQSGYGSSNKFGRTGGPGYFTCGLARLVSGAGRVYAVNLQPAMLDLVRQRAERKVTISRAMLFEK